MNKEQGTYMEHGAYWVDVLDETGKVIGKKLRREINKMTDIFHGIYVLMITPTGELILASIPAREDLPNLYVRQLSVTTSTIRRHQETPFEAAQRASSRELFIEEAELQELGHGMFIFNDGRPGYVSAYYMIGEAPHTFSVIDIDSLAVLSPREIRDNMRDHPDYFAPTFQTFWREFSDKLPI